MTTGSAARAVAPCPRHHCGAGIGSNCNTSTGRNHRERIKLAIIRSLNSLTDDPALKIDEGLALVSS